MPRPALNPQDNFVQNKIDYVPVTLGFALLQNAQMTSLATTLKSEIARLARKEVRAATSGLQKAVSSYRSQIAELKRRNLALERAVKQLQKGARPSTKVAAPAEAPLLSGKVRYSAKSLAAQRRRLGLSAADFGALIGASSLSIYHWESGKSRPRDRFIAALAGIRSIGRREAAARLAAMRGK